MRERLVLHFCISALYMDKRTLNPLNNLVHCSNKRPVRERPIRDSLRSLEGFEDVVRKASRPNFAIQVLTFTDKLADLQDA